MFKEFVIDMPDEQTFDEDDENAPPPKAFFIVFTVSAMVSGLYMIAKGFMGGW